MTSPPSLYLVATAAPPVLNITEAIADLQDRWDVSLILSPTAATWIDVDEVVESTGVPVRSAPRMPSDKDPLPPADAVLAAPLTFTTLNKWASGIADTIAVGILCELLGARVPITAITCAKGELRDHPAYQTSVDVLSGSGVRFLDSDPLTYRDPSGLAAYRWKMVAEKVAPETVR